MAEYMKRKYRNDNDLKTTSYESSMVPYRKSNYAPPFTMELEEELEPTCLPMEIMDHIFDYVQDIKTIVASRPFQSIHFKKKTYYLSFDDFLQSIDGTLANFKWLLNRKDGPKNLNAAFFSYGLFIFHRPAESQLVYLLIDTLSLSNIVLFHQYCVLTQHRGYLKLLLDTKEVVCNFNREETIGPFVAYMLFSRQQTSEIDPQILKRLKIKTMEQKI